MGYTSRIEEAEFQINDTRKIEWPLKIQAWEAKPTVYNSLQELEKDFDLEFRLTEEKCPTCNQCITTPKVLGIIGDWDCKRYYIYNMLAALLPYVEPGMYVQIIGEDGDVSRFALHINKKGTRELVSMISTTTWTFPT